jgi:hypothetical protein
MRRLATNETGPELTLERLLAEQQPSSAETLAPAREMQAGSGETVDAGAR